MLKPVLSAVWGLLGGAAEFFLLRRVVFAVTSQGKINALHILLFAMLPMALLLPVAFIATEHILLCGSCTAGVLILAAAVHFLRGRKK